MNKKHKEDYPTMKMYPIEDNGSKKHWVETQFNKILTVQFAGIIEGVIIEDMLNRGYAALTKNTFSKMLSIYDLRDEQVYLMNKYNARFK